MSEHGNSTIQDREKDAYIWDTKKAETGSEVASILNNNLDFDSVLDMGSGTMVYKPFFKTLGKKYLGVDGNPDSNADKIIDLTVEQNLGVYDLVLCIEVAEHIYPDKVGVFVDNLIRHAGKYIVMTTCPPYRNTRPSEYDLRAHQNEQDKDYWIDRINRSGLKYNRELTNKLQLEFKEVKGMMSWFRDDLMIYVRNSSI